MTPDRLLATSPLTLQTLYATKPSPCPTCVEPSRLTTLSKAQGVDTECLACFMGWKKGIDYD